MRSASQITTAAGGRRIIQAEDDGPALVALPVHVAGEALAPHETAVLMRFMEASEMHKGNMSVIILHGEGGGEAIARGRYERVQDRVDPKTYAEFEIDAYRWIVKKALGTPLAYLAQLIADMNAERGTVNVEVLGRSVTNSRDASIALGGAIASIRACAWTLADAYRDYYELWKVREEAAQAGRRLTDDEATQRLRRARLVSNVVKAYRPKA